MEAGLKEMLGEAAYVENPLPSMGSEDFAYYAPEVPSAMYRLGVGVPGRENASLHSSRFDPDERALSTGVCSLVGVAMMLMEHFSIDGE